MSFATANLYDEYADKLQVATPMFNDYGGVSCFCGPIATVKVFEDNVLVHEALCEPGDGRILVVDGEGSLQCALIGDRLVQLAQENGWRGIVVHGCIRDSAEIEKIPIGVKALSTSPRKSAKDRTGERDIVVTFAGATFAPGNYLYADKDGIVVAAERLL
jgi:regulator of ribonuclease activity A